MVGTGVASRFDKLVGALGAPHGPGLPRDVAETYCEMPHTVVKDFLKYGLKFHFDLGVTQELQALESSDVLKLFEMGVHAFLLNNLGRHELFGVNSQNYFPPIRGQASP